LLLLKPFICYYSIFLYICQNSNLKMKPALRLFLDFQLLVMGSNFIIHFKSINRLHLLKLFVNQIKIINYFFLHLLLKDAVIQMNHHLLRVLFLFNYYNCIIIKNPEILNYYYFFVKVYVMIEKV
jgi:hypothetical protein